jgi:hypothetical protein
MENKRARKFVYFYEKWDDNIITNLKLFQCNYHIFGEEKISNLLKGCIYFANPRAVNNIKKKLGGNIYIDNFDDDINKYMELVNVWENGERPTQGKRKKYMKQNTNINTNTTTNELTPVTNSILDQNTSLIEQSKEICQYLMKQNQQLLEENKQLKQTTTSTNTMTINNNIEKLENNKTFNINVFLNEDCKNAITLGEFINSLKIEDSDLFCAKEKGLVEAITNIFHRGLENCDINSRPVHCTDTKRETLHIKDDEGWVKESGSESKRMKNAITRISNNKIKKLSEYIKEHPEFNNVRSPQYEDCLQMMRNVMGASEDSEKTEKRVLKNIAKSVYLNSESSK